MHSDNLAKLTRSEIADAATLIALAIAHEREWREIAAVSHDDFAICTDCWETYHDDERRKRPHRRFFADGSGAVICEFCAPEDAA